MAEGRFNKGTKVKWPAYEQRAAGSGTVDRYESNGKAGREHEMHVVVKMAGGGEVKMNDGSLAPA